MTTILGPLPCATCKAPVTVVRRTFVFACRAHGRSRRVCTSESLSLTVVEPDGTTHLCQRERQAVAA